MSDFLDNQIGPAPENKFLEWAILHMLQLKRAAKFLSYQILKKEGIPTGTLENILQPTTAQFAGIRKEAKPLFAEYQHAVKNLKTAYSGDLDPYAYAIA